jgi:zinc transport system substrate-binding protein
LNAIAVLLIKFNRRITMKKLYMPAVFFLTAAVIFSGCGKQNAAPADRTAKNGDRITVIAAIFPLFDFARAVAGDKADVVMLLPPGSESHSFEPSPRDIIAVQNSALFLYIGGESDGWVKRILGSVDTRKTLALIDRVEAVEEEIVEGMQEDDEEEDAAYDEHIWTSPRNAALMVRAIADALCEVDGGNAQTYRANADSYIVQLEELDAAFRAVAESAARTTIVFGDRFPFRYFADAYGLDYFAAFPGCSTETEPSAATVAFLIDKVKAERIPVVFHIELSNEKMADTIAEATGAKKLLLHSAHNVTKKDFEAGITYLDVQRGNIERLKEALR